MRKIFFDKKQNAVERLLDVVDTYKNEFLGEDTTFQCTDGELDALIFINTIKETNLTCFIYYKQCGWRDECEMLAQIDFNKMLFHNFMDKDIISSLFRRGQAYTGEEIFRRGYTLKKYEDEKYTEEFYKNIKSILSKYIKSEDFIMKITLECKTREIDNKIIHKEITHNNMQELAYKIYSMYNANPENSFEFELYNRFERDLYYLKSFKNLLNECLNNRIEMDKIINVIEKDENLCNDIFNIYVQVIEMREFRKAYSKYFDILQKKNLDRIKLYNIIEEIKNQFGNRKRVKYGKRLDFGKDELYLRNGYGYISTITKQMNKDTFGIDFEEEEMNNIIISSYNISLTMNKNNVRQILENTTYRNKMIFNIDKIEEMFKEID